MRGEEPSLKDKLEPLLKKLPAVERPLGHVHFRSKLAWTIGILVLYYILANVPIFGLSAESIDMFELYRAIVAGASGSIIQLGIGPIVMGSIILQLFVGAEIIKLDLKDPRDQAFFQGAQKLLVFFMIIFEALPQIMGGFLKPDTALAARLGVDISVITLLIFLQICIGGLLIVFMDEVVSKWGIGSGVSLFIVAGVAEALVKGIFSWKLNQIGLPIGIIPKWYYILTTYPLDQLLTGNGLLSLLIEGEVLALIATVAVFLIVTYVESVRIEIPLAHGAVRGARGKFPVKLIYASVLPMILVRALQANIQMIGMLLWRSSLPILGHNPWIGEFQGTQPISGLMYYLSPIHGPGDWIPVYVIQRIPSLEVWQIALHVIVDAVILILGGILFAIFWIHTTGMGPKETAEKIAASGMLIPGFRREPGIIQKVMARYIPKVTHISGAFIGALTLLASLFGLIGQVGGTGMLLAVSIVYHLYEQLAKEQVMEMHPLMRKLLGEE